MEKSFAGLLRNSRLASYDKKLNQVYRVSRENQKKGNWGLKRNLPSVIRTPFVTIADLDTAEHQTPWKSGTSQVMFVRRWKENFPNSKKPVSRPEQVENNVALMTPAEFKRFVKTASKRAAPAFQQQLANKTLKHEQVYEYLGVTFTDTNASSVVVGPTYSDHDVEMNYPVEGRFLNNDREGCAVGVGGVVALCLKRHLSNTRLMGDRRQRVFYVEEASIDPQGRPHVIVSPYKPGASSIPAILGGDPYDRSSSFSSSSSSSSSSSGMNAEDMFNPRKRDRAHQNRTARDMPDNIQENPKHKHLMECLDVFAERAEKHQQEQPVDEKDDKTSEN